MLSKALEINLERSRVEVSIADRYRVLLEVMSRYAGVTEGLQAFLKELCHPFRNWRFIVKDARGYALDYFHLLKAHPKGVPAARVYVDIFLEAVTEAREGEVRTDAADNLLLYLQRMIEEPAEELGPFLPVLDYAFSRIRNCKGEDFALFVQSYYQIGKQAKGLLEKAPEGTDFGPVNGLLEKYLREGFAYWLGEEDPQAWFRGKVGLQEGLAQDLAAFFGPVSHARLEACRGELEEALALYGRSSRSLLEKLVQLPGYNRFVEAYRRVPGALAKAGEATGAGDYWKLIFLFRLMDISGLVSIHEETLREINRTLTGLITRSGAAMARQSIRRTFDILETSARKYPGTALHCVLNIGKAVYQTGDADLVDVFIDAVIDLRFQTPDLRGVDEERRIRANAAHIQNIRTWLELIGMNPKLSKRLLSALIIHLSLTGVFIKDTDLFPRDITRLLNADIAPVYNLTKQLTRLFPAYFNDIGAEGRLREISTRIDEISLRRDVLIHFLRKQSHVESSNQIVAFTEATLDFWRTRDPEGLRPFLPAYVYEQIEPEGPYVGGVHRLMVRLFKAHGLAAIRDLLELDEGALEGIREALPDVVKADQERVILGITLYRLVHQKYNLGFIGLAQYLGQVRPGTFPKVEDLQAALSEKDPKERLSGLLDYMQACRELILSPARYEVREDVYHKRHFNVDIPSMYGSYYEMKFNTLGLTFRLEPLVNTLFEELTDGIDLNLITGATFSQIFDCLRLFYRALELDGVPSLEMKSQLDLLAQALEVQGFSFSQFVDIFRGFSQAVKNIVDGCFNDVHERNLGRILPRLSAADLLPKYRPQEGDMDPAQLAHRVTEIFLRDRIASSLGLQQLDVFLTRILSTLFQQSSRLPKDESRLLLNYDPQKAMTSIRHVTRRVSHVIYLGNKGLNLVKLYRFGFPVPAGFIITTEVFRVRDIIDRYPPAEGNLRAQITRQLSLLEEQSGRGFGDPRRPLLLSVRSGAPISQPGMMDTFLNVGINEDIVRGMIARTGEAWFAWDCYRRFLQTYGMAFGLARDDFDAIIGDFKLRLGVPIKRDFSGEQMKAVAMAYRDFLRGRDVRIEDSPFEQLLVAVGKVFDSWNSDKAETYRKIIGISDDWGTAVTVQTMVFGNCSSGSGAGVVFTHSPRRVGDTVRLWGDFTVGNQGEDVVSGLVKTLPISREQAEMENRAGDIILETHFPAIYAEILRLTEHLIYDMKWGPQEIEFTFESPSKEDLYFLQTRDMGIRGRKKVLAFAAGAEAESRPLGQAIGVSGGAMSGRVVYSSEEIELWRRREPQTPLILVRGDTVPDDIKEIHEADGLLTGRGGSTSHAAIVAHRLGKTCLVGCAELNCMEKQSACSLNGVRLRSGDWISIDGRKGTVYKGVLEITETGADSPA